MLEIMKTVFPNSRAPGGVFALAYADQTERDHIVAGIGNL
jgi:hypothetical protein